MQAKLFVDILAGSIIKSR